MAHFRFNLRTLFILATVVIALVGFSQWHRQQILRQVKEIRQLGGDVELPNDFRDYLWQRRPTRGTVTIGPWANANNVGDRAAEARDRLRSMGITDITTYHLY